MSSHDYRDHNKGCDCVSRGVDHPKGICQSSTNTREGMLLAISESLTASHLSVRSSYRALASEMVRRGYHRPCYFLPSTMFLFLVFICDLCPSPPRVPSSLQNDCFSPPGYRVSKREKQSVVRTNQHKETN